MTMKHKNRNLPRDVMEQLANRALLEKMAGITRHNKPGEMIQNLGPIKKQVLSDLTSNDIKDIRWIG